MLLFLSITKRIEGKKSGIGGRHRSLSSLGLGPNELYVEGVEEQHTSLAGGLAGEN